MDICIQPGTLSGSLDIPPSKSVAHRVAICAALAQGESRILGVENTKDMAATIACAQALGADCSLKEGALTITGIAAPHPKANMRCGESASTLRFFLPIAAALGVTASFTGEGQLPRRPVTPLTDALSAHGVAVTREGDEILTLSGQLTGGLFSLPGNVSSQYISGLLFALPLLPEDSEIRLTTALESEGYVDLTLQALAQAGIQVERAEQGYRVPGGQQYRPWNGTVERDYSSAAFWLCAGALGSDIVVKNLNPQSLQGDRAILSVLERLGGVVEDGPGWARVRSGHLRGAQIGVSHIPDLAPVLAATAAYVPGSTTIGEAGRLRIKECDRLAAITQGLRAMGADVAEFPDKLVIIGRHQLPGGVAVDSCGDHRIAMALSVAALGCRREVTVRGAQCVDKSYPGFYDDFKKLGGRCHVV